MHDTTSRGRAWHPAGARPSIPWVLLIAVLTMGSGMGNPGCGGDDSAASCAGGCEIQGAYVLRFDDTASPGPECEASGVVLPEGRTLTLARAGDGVSVTATLEGEDLTLTGSYFGGGLPSLDLVGRKELRGREQPPFTLRFDVAGLFSTAPRRASDEVTYWGTFRVTAEHTVEGQPRCSFERSFVATR